MIIYFSNLEASEVWNTVACLASCPLQYVIYSFMQILLIYIAAPIINTWVLPN